MGLRVARTWEHDTDQAPTLTTVWVRGNLFHEFTAPSTNVSSEDGPPLCSQPRTMVGRSQYRRHQADEPKRGAAVLGGRPVDAR